MREELKAEKIDMVTFTSSSTVRNFVDMLDCKDNRALQELLDGVMIAAIGPITGQTVREYGLAVHVQPETYTIPAMVQAIVDEIGAG